MRQISTLAAATCRKCLLHPHDSTICLPRCAHHMLLPPSKTCWQHGTSGHEVSHEGPCACRDLPRASCLRHPALPTGSPVPRVSTQLDL